MALGGLLFGTTSFLPVHANAQYQILEYGPEVVEVAPEIYEGLETVGQRPVQPYTVPQRYVPPPQYRFFSYQAPPAPFQYRQYAPAYPNFGPVILRRR